MLVRKGRASRDDQHRRCDRDKNEPLVVSKVQVYEFDGKQFLDPSVTKGFPDFGVC